MKTKVLSMVMLVALVLSMGLSASAAEVSPQWDTSNRCTPVLTFSGTKATCSAVVVAADSSAKITATMTLYRTNSDGSRTQVKTWTNLTGTGRLDISKTYSPVVSGSTYRLVVSGFIAGASFSNHQNKTCP